MPSMPEPEDPESLTDRMREGVGEVVRIAQKPSSVPNAFIWSLFVVIVLLVLVR